MEQKGQQVTAAETSPFEARTEVEVVSMMIIQGVLIVIRFIAIFYFILMSIQHSKYQGEKRDKFTYFTFLFLAISQTFFNVTMLGVLIKEIADYLSFKDPDSYQNFKAFFETNAALLTQIEGVFRLGISYHLQNLAFLINIHRWERIIMGSNPEFQKKGGITVDPIAKEKKIILRKSASMQKSTVPSDNISVNNGIQQNQSYILQNLKSLGETVETELILSQNYIHQRFFLKTILILSFAIISVSWLFLQLPELDLFTLIYQGAVINSMIIVGYIYIYKRMRDYHSFIIDQQSKIYSSQEILRIHKTNNEIRLFFLYICVNLMMQQFYLGSKWYADFDNFSDDSKRYNDIIRIVLLVSSILNYYGISSSIKRAFTAQQKRNKNIKKIRYQQFLSAEIGIDGKSLKSSQKEESLKSLSSQKQDGQKQSEELDFFRHSVNQEDEDEINLIARQGSLFIDTNYEDDDDLSESYTQVIRIQKKEFEQQLDRNDSISMLRSMSGYSGISGERDSAFNTSQMRNRQIQNAEGVIQYVAKVQY